MRRIGVLSIIHFIVALIVFGSNALHASQNAYQNDKEEVRWAVQKQANVLTDSDSVLLSRAALEVLPHNDTVSFSGYKPNPLTIDELKSWLGALPPSQSKQINQQLANASPASFQKILGEAYLPRLAEINRKLKARETFCALSDGLGKIGFDGKNYQFPVGIFTWVGGVHNETYILQNGKQFRNTPAQLVSDADYAKIKSYTEDPRFVFRVCWKDVPGHIKNPKELDPLTNYAIEIIGNFEIYDTEARKSVFSFPSNWFFY